MIAPMIIATKRSIPGLASRVGHPNLFVQLEQSPDGPVTAHPTGSISTQYEM
jgi:hypothetical protein